MLIPSSNALSVLTLALMVRIVFILSYSAGFQYAFEVPMSQRHYLDGSLDLSLNEVAGSALQMHMDENSDWCS